MQADPLTSGTTTELTQGIVPAIDFDALMPLITASIAVTSVISILFLIYIIFNSIRHFKVEKATLEMQKDIRRMRELMEQGSTAVTPAPASPRVDLIASSKPESSSTTA